MKLDCGIKYERIAFWLSDELALEFKEGSWLFVCSQGCCRIELSPLPPRTYGLISLDRTLVTATGDERALAEFNHLFTLRFISAGG